MHPGDQDPDGIFGLERVEAKAALGIGAQAGCEVASTEDEHGHALDGIGVLVDHAAVDWAGLGKG
ncbi:MAG: hypothetical protein R3E96_12175 [Planctomycetota bacterium]